MLHPYCLLFLIYHLSFIHSQLYIIFSVWPFGHHSILCFVLPLVANAFAIDGKMFCHRWQIVFSLVIKSSTLSSFREFHRWNSASHLAVFPFTPCCDRFHNMLRFQSPLPPAPPEPILRRARVGERGLRSSYNADDLHRVNLVEVGIFLIIGDLIFSS